MRARGFTLVELLVVLLLVALLASLVTPVVMQSISRAKESTLKEDLFVMRKAIDDYYADKGGYPDDLDTLATERYIRRVPVDPITEARDWVLVQSDDPEQTGIVDVNSAADARASDGSRYNEW